MNRHRAALVLFVMQWPRGIVGAVEAVGQRLRRPRGGAGDTSTGAR